MHRRNMSKKTSVFYYNLRKTLSLLPETSALEMWYFCFACLPLGVIMTIL